MYRMHKMTFPHTLFFLFFLVCHFLCEGVIFDKKEGGGLFDRKGGGILDGFPLYLAGIPL